MQLKLASKYTAISCTALLVIMFTFAFFHVNTLRESFLAEAMYEADTLSEMILHNSHYLMLKNDRVQLQQVIDEAGTMARIQQIRILGREGVVSFSTDKTEIGTALSNDDEGCYFCHVGKSTALIDASIETRSRNFTDVYGKDFLGMTSAIYNEPSCYTADCHFHSEEEKKLGVLDVVVSLEKMQAVTFNHHADVFVSTAVMLVLMSICQFVFTQKYVCQPVQRLVRHTERLARGDLDVRIENVPTDEFGELGEAFNSMASSLEQAQLELRDWAGTLEQKVEKRTEEIQEMQAQLVQSAKLASMGELVAGIAHEINNPLGGILMFSSLAAKNPELPPQVKDNLEVVVSETRRCAKIVRGLLEFSRESIPEKRSDSINRIIKQTLRLVSQQTLFQDIEMDCEFDETLPELHLDPDQIQQVFFNMFINAAQAMHDGGGILSITTERDNELESVIRVIVADNGQGIEKESLNKIFDPFFSTKSKKGFGLGLSISYGIINNHGGKISVQSELGVGTQFTILLPIDENVTLAETDADSILLPGSAESDGEA
ncbi:two-component system, NtrC family, sensor kinase [Malonomonas rubra DSM 5091]|uniref:histidine kinase n=1 Tax=Malonomonas rubra DSM 5091 TaxID=1122189 RepID=A0A1M6HGN9_MALRU|nr:HAMP domain-containing histidine kinase [Malonomonas rubra]SHJ21335.1 two-component system, NtrC family, sensor kinase [Malonomonas rubra DSM 5091]